MYNSFVDPIIASNPETLGFLSDVSNVFTILIRLLLVVLCAGMIGIERSKKKHSAGLRTYMLVCLGAAVIMILGDFLVLSMPDGTDVGRLGAQVISGIGFLGAGTILVTSKNRIKGLTTAAGLWASAGIGLALGIGFYEGALTAGLAIYLILTALQRWDDKMHQNAKVMELYIEQAEDRSLGSLIRQLRGMDVEIDGLQTENDGAIEDGARAMIVTLRLRKKSNHPLLIKDIMKMDGVLYVEEL